MPEVVTDFQRNRVRIEDKLRRKRILGFLEAHGMLEHIRALEAEVKWLVRANEVATKVRWNLEAELAKVKDWSMTWQARAEKAEAAAKPA